jgi:AraC-like DNA-binding protein
VDKSDRESPYGAAPQRMAALVGLPGLLAEFGATLADLLDGLPLEPSVFDSDENRISYGLATELLARAARISGSAHFGLTLGTRFDHRCMGLAGRWMQHSPTLGAALSGFIALQPTATEGATSFLHRHGDQVIFGYGAYDRTSLDYVQNYLVVIPMAFNIVRTLSNGKAVVTEILFSFRKPLDTLPYSQFFGVPVRFDQPVTGLVLQYASLDVPVAGAEPAEFAAIRSRAEALLQQSRQTVAGRVARALKGALVIGKSGRTDIASQIGVHHRAMARQLAKEGTSFQAQLDSARFHAARELLALTDLASGDIALSVGFENPGAFTAAFKGWCGTTPGVWRAAFKAGELIVLPA